MKERTYVPLSVTLTKNHEVKVLRDLMGITRYKRKKDMLVDSLRTHYKIKDLHKSTDNGMKFSEFLEWMIELTKKELEGRR